MTMHIVMETAEQNPKVVLVLLAWAAMVEVLLMAM